jgi:hypothetical protein
VSNKSRIKPRIFAHTLGDMLSFTHLVAEKSSADILDKYKNQKAKLNPFLAYIEMKKSKKHG